MVITKLRNDDNKYPRGCGWFGTFLFFIVMGMTQTAYAEECEQTITSDNGLFYLWCHDEKIAQLADIATTSSKPISYNLLEGKFRIEKLDINRHGMPVIYAYYNDELIQSLMIRQGIAFAFFNKRYQHSLSLLQEEPALFRRAIDHSQSSKQLHRHARVMGEIKEVAIMRNATYLNFGKDWKSDFTIYIPKEIMRSINQEWLESLRGKTIIVRGFIHPYYGPRITLLNPDMIQVINEHTE